jgi:hypothetical protein
MEFFASFFAGEEGFQVKAADKIQIGLEESSI